MRYMHSGFRILRVDVKRSIVTGSILGSITSLQLPTLNVMGTLCDLFDVSMDIYHSELWEMSVTLTKCSFT